MTDLHRALATLGTARSLVALVDAARADAAHWRAMYRALWHVACEQVASDATVLDRRMDCIAMQRDQLRETRRLLWIAVMLAQREP